MPLFGFLKGTGPSGYGYNSTAEDVVEGLALEGKTILLTGCNSGIGYDTLSALAGRGATVLGAARTREKAEHACASVEGDAVGVACELSDPESVLGCVEAVRERGEPLDAIICNAGIMALPKLEQAYGYELQFFVNHIAHALLVIELLEQLAEKGRVVMVSSEAHKRAPKGGIRFDNLSGEKGYKPWEAYGQSKLANLLFARELARRMEGTEQVANAVHPGVIATNLTRHMNPAIEMAWKAMGPLFSKSSEQGAATQTYVATHPDVEDLSGEYFKDCNIAPSSRRGTDMELAGRLWEETERILKEIT